MDCVLIADSGSTKTDSAETGRMPVQNQIPETENWKEKIFGSDAGLVQDKQVFITGLSASEKEKLSWICTGHFRIFPGQRTDSQL